MGIPVFIFFINTFSPSYIFCLFGIPMFLILPFQASFCQAKNSPLQALAMHEMSLQPSAFYRYVSTVLCSEKFYLL